MSRASPPPLESNRLLFAAAVWLGLSGAALANQKFLNESAPAAAQGYLSLCLWGLTILAGVTVAYLLNGRLPVSLRLEAAIRISAPPSVAMCFAAFVILRLGCPQVIFTPIMLLSISPIALWLDSSRGHTSWAIYITLTGLAVAALISPAMAFVMQAIGCVFLVAVASGSKSLK